jgi:hypothetical protein
MGLDPASVPSSTARREAAEDVFNDHILRRLSVGFGSGRPGAAHHCSRQQPLMRPRRVEPLAMLCCRGTPHAGAPEGDYSCGAHWPYEAEF